MFRETELSLDAVYDIASLIVDCIPHLSFESPTITAYTGCGERFSGHVTPGNGQFVVLFGQPSAYEADDGGPFVPRCRMVSAAPHLLVEPALGWLQLQADQCSTGKTVEVSGGSGASTACRRTW